MKRRNIRKSMRSIVSLLMVVVLLATTLCSNSVITQAAQEHVTDNKGNASHIDIGVSATASVVIGSTTYSNSDIEITGSDFTSSAVTITATQTVNNTTTTLVGSSSSSDWRTSGGGNETNYTITTTNVDFVYNLSDLSTSEGASGISQVRIGGCFPVGSKANPVVYTVTLVKSVTLYANGDTNSTDTITVTVTLSASFGYWDSDNDCPGLGGNWSSGGFSSGSGFDFLVTSADDLISITKVVVDENGDPLTIDEVDGQQFNYTVTSPTTGTTTTDSGTITVGNSGVGVAAIEVSDMSDFAVTETSYPDTIGDYSFVSSSVAYDSTNHTATITNVYSIPTTEVTVTKEWDDAANTDYRPEEITVYLLADGDYAKDDSGAYITATLNSENNWTYTFTGLTAKSGGKEIAYMVEEASVDGYTSVITGDAATGYTITNTLNVGQLELTKTVNDPDDAADATTFTFLVSGFDTSVTSISDSDGNAYSVVDGVATILVPEDTTVTLVYVPVGTYTVTEYGTATDSDGNITATVNTYTWTVDVAGAEEGEDSVTATVAAGQTATVEITNTITGTATVVLTKEWDDLSNYWSTRPDSIEVTLTAVDDSGATYVDSEGNTYIYTVTAWSGTGDTWTYSLAGVAAYDVDGNKLTYNVTETAVDGYTTTYTYNSDGGLTPADNVNATITNTLNAGTVTVTKVVLDADGNEVSSTENDDDFRFALWADNGNGTTTSYGTATLVAGGTATFENIPYGDYYLTEYLVGSHVHSYVTTVTVDGTDVTVTEDYSYITSESAWAKTHTVDVTVDEDSKSVAIVVTNQEEEVSVDLAALVNGTKTLVTDDEVEKTFNFIVQDSDSNTVATGTATVSDTNATTSITWTVIDADAFTYTEVGTYTYVIYEVEETGVGTGGVVYDATRYTLTITVSKDSSNGELIATASMIKNVQNSDGSRTTSDVTSDEGKTSFVADSTDSSWTGTTDSFTAAFTNTYDTTETSLILRATKSLTGRTLSANEFSIQIEEVDESGDPISGSTTVTRSNGATGAFGYEIIYTSAGEYYYKVSEVIPSTATLNSDGTYTLNGVTYDNSYYIIWVEVTDEDGVLTVKSTATTGYIYDASSGTYINGLGYSYDTMVFRNTYKATGDGTLSVIKVLMGRDFNLGDTFTFTITALDSAAPALTDPGVSGVEFTDNGDGTYTVTVKVLASDDSEESQNTNYSDTYLLTWLLASLTADQDDVGSWVYRISEETGTANGMTYDIATYGHLITVTVADNGDGTLKVTTSSTNDTDWNGDSTTDTTKSVIVNSFSQGSTNIYGAKNWVDGGATHDNTTEVKLTLYYSTDGGTTWTAWTLNSDNTTYSIDGEGSYAVEWGTLNTNRWRILNLPVYDSTGAAYTYMVEETAIDGYVTTYSNDSTVYDSSYSDTNRFTITNTIEQEYIKLYGTKKWVDDSTEETHDNADEITLIVTRNSDSTELTTLTEVEYPGTGVADTYIVVWDENVYAIYWYCDATDGYVGLPKYDAAGYEYIYNVAEDTVTGTSKSGETFTYETETDFYFDADGYSVFDFTNRQPNDPPTDPEKDVDTDEDGIYGDDGEKISVGDTVTYIIKYYNNTNTEADVTITDVLDNGVTYVSSLPEGVLSGQSTDGTASDGSTFSYGGTVTWTIEKVAPFTEGYVTLTVEVNENARSHDTGESGADIDNQASVAVAGNSADTNLVTNPLEDDDPEDPVKSIMRVDSEDGEEKTTADSNGNIIVAVGDYVYYTIRAYNHYATGATLTITDVLDDGVEFVNATGYATGACVYDDVTHTVTWTVNVNAFSYATVTLVVKVTEDAKTAEQTYDAVDPEDPTSEYEKYTYTTSASIANQASIVNSNDVTVTTYTNVPENPLEDDDPEAPTKAISSSSPSGYYDSNGDAGVTTDADGNQTGTSVGIGGLIEYDITYYNNYNKQVTVVITDTLDAGVDFKSASGTEVTSTEVQTGITAENYVTYNVTTANGVTTVTWIIYNATALKEGTVTLVVEVNENAKTVETGETEATVENTASVKIDTDNAVDTNYVENPIDPDQPGDPSKVVAASSEAGADGAAVKVGDTITYEISYYNHNSEAANATIVDVLDEGVDFISAGTVVKTSDVDVDNITETNYVTYEYDKTTHTVTWTIYNIAPFTGDVVTLIVEVNENARVVDDGDTEADVDNQATLIMVDHTADTNIVTNPVADDDPTDPTKDVAETSKDGTEGRTEDKDAETITYGDVAVGDQITYVITYYNNLNEAATVTIIDPLDEGVDFVEASDGGVYDADSHTVTWTLAVDAFTPGSVTLTVEVNENAKLIETDETLATVENQASVQIGTGNVDYTYTVIHPITPDDPEDPVKTEVVPGTGEEATVVSTDADGTKTYEEVAVGTILVYDITWYNNNNYVADVVITDVLDEGVDFVSASDGGVYDANTHTVTWTFADTAPFTGGSVVLEVEVNANAKSTDDGESQATVENQATVTVGEVDNDTNIVVNPINPDDPEEPTKAVDANSEAGVEGDAASVGETITYVISFYNHENESVIVTITDALDPGVDFVSASDGGTYDETAHTVTWTLEGVSAYADGYVTLTVMVNENAKLIENGEDEATVENTASVQIGNNSAVETNKVETPLDPEDPVDPTKEISESSASGYLDENGDPAVEVDEDGTVTGSSVGVGGIIEYVITYYNHTSQAATVIITDELDPGVIFESASGVKVEDATALDTSIEAVGYDYVTYRIETVTDADGNEVTTVIWTIYNATPYAYGSVLLQVEVIEDAKTVEDDETTATVENDAEVVISADPDNTYTTNLVINPIDPDEPGDPVKTVTADSEAGVDGAAVDVGDQITYAITYYNHTNTAAEVTITDALDPGVAFVSASDGGVYDEDTHTVTWKISDVTAYTGGYVTLTVEVTEDALKLDEGDTSADVENQATVTVGDVTNDTDILVNPINPDDPADPTKYVSEDSAAGSEVISEDEDGTITYETVGIGDRITYVIEYYNHNSEIITVTITDVLDAGVDFISASDDGVYDEETHTVTWTINVDPYTGGYVTLIAEVNEDAKTVGEDEDTATVENTAAVQIGNETAVDTNTVIHPVDPDDPVDPSKTVVSDAGAAGDAVAVGDEVTYEIVYYNYNNETADVIITDVLDPGATFVSASGDYEVTTAEDGTVTVTWTITGVDPYTTGYVTLTVQVNENARTIEDDETQATITNTASVQIGNDAAVDTNTVENPVTPDDPVDPTKTITTDGVSEGDEVAAGDELTYTITYYNHTNEVATVVITDTLDDGVDFVSATNGGVYDADTHTVTWTLTVNPFTEGSVTVTVKVNESAVTQVENTASVQIGNEETVDTNTVTNPVEEEEEVPVTTPTEPETETEPVPTTSDTEAIVPYTILMIMAFMAIVILLKGRREEQA